MRAMVLTGTLTLALASTAGSNGPTAAQEPPRFRSAVDMVTVAAVVRDKRGRFVTDLSPEDFQVVDAGEPRPLLDFRAELDGPVKLAVLLDVSGSMRLGQRTEDARQVAHHLFSHLGEADLAAVYTFDTALTEAQPFIASREGLVAALESADVPYGQTSLYDAIGQTARAVASTAGDGMLQRSAVVVITDGIDTHSRMTPREVSMLASEIDVPVYIVAVAAGVDDPRETGQRRQAEVASDLQQLARGTGGDLFIASAPSEASQAARQMVDELRHQYVLAFEASGRAGWQPLEVRTRRGSLVVRARTGYSSAGVASGETSRVR